VSTVRGAAVERAWEAWWEAVDEYNAVRQAEDAHVARSRVAWLMPVFWRRRRQLARIQVEVERRLAVAVEAGK
jgi:hypothetical protein